MAIKKHTYIHEFDPCIYPRKLWVIKGGTLEGIREQMIVSDKLEIDPDEQGAVTFPATLKKTGLYGYCVWFPSAKDIRRGDWIAHEATHVALSIFSDIGMLVEYENQETLAYMVGWVYECIDEVRRFKNGGYKSESGNGEKVIAEETCESEEAHRNG